jgi:hypothetical protein
MDDSRETLGRVRFLVNDFRRSLFSPSGRESFMQRFAGRCPGACDIFASNQSGRLPPPRKGCLVVNLFETWKFREISWFDANILPVHTP